MEYTSQQWYQHNTLSKVISIQQLPKVVVPKITQELQKLAFKADSMALFQILPSYQKTQKNSKKKTHETTSANLLLCNFSLAILSLTLAFSSLRLTTFSLPLDSSSIAWVRIFLSIATFSLSLAFFFLLLWNSYLILVHIDSCKENGCNFRPTLTCFAIQPPKVFTSRLIILQTKSNQGYS